MEVINKKITIARSLSSPIPESRYPKNKPRRDIRDLGEALSRSPLHRLILTRRGWVFARSLAMGSRIFALPLLVFILVYQKTLSPDHGMFKSLFPYGYCKFYPTCSQYAALVLRKDGILGLPKIIRRLISCRPGVSPAVDLP